jgi:hypothetical protein
MCDPPERVKSVVFETKTRLTRVTRHGREDCRVLPTFYIYVEYIYVQGATSRFKTFDIQYSIVNIQHSTFKTRKAAIPLLLRIILNNLHVLFVHLRSNLNLPVERISIVSLIFVPFFAYLIE